MAHQWLVAGNEQSCSSQTLSNQSFLAEITLPPHHHQRFALYHIWTDLWAVTQHSGGHIDQRVLSLKNGKQYVIRIALKFLSFPFGKHMSLL